MNELSVYHDSFNIEYRSPFGAVPTMQEIELKLRVQSNEPVEDVTLRLWHRDSGEEKIPMANDANHTGLYTASFVPKTHEILWYYFELRYKDTLYYYSRQSDRYSGVGYLDTTPHHSYQITVHKKDFTIPKWYREGIIYQIFPDRFFMSTPRVFNNNLSRVKKHAHFYIHDKWDATPFYEPDRTTGKIENNDFFGGSLKGIMDKLDYLKELGISIIYLNPIYEAYSNHRYDIGDYMKVDPMLGDMNTFRGLCKEAEIRGISIILDGVFSHTGSDSVYFNKNNFYRSVGAYQSKASPYYSWYRFEKYPEKYDSWWGVKTLPNVNELEPSYMDFIIKGENSVAKYWLKQGARGWRLDVADELPDAFLKEFRKAVKAVDPEAVIIGEVWEDASNKVSYGSLREYLLGEELDGAMNYPFRDMMLDFILGRCTAEQLYNKIMVLYENYPRAAFYGAMNLLGTHDVTRLRTILGEAPEEESITRGDQAKYKLTEEQKSLADKRQRIAVLLQMTFPGVPSIYYGDEAGMDGYRDPFNRGTYPWRNQDRALINYYGMLTKLRKSIPALHKGGFAPVIFNGTIFGFIRQIESNKDAFGEYSENSLALIIVNSDKEQPHDVSLDLTAYNINNLTNASGNIDGFTLKDGILTTKLPPLSGILLKQ